MIPTIETICEDLKAGNITVQQAIAWLHQHAEGAANDLRDHFASQALAGLYAAHEANGAWSAPGCEEKAAEHAYRVADAMLKVRSA